MDAQASSGRELFATLDSSLACSFCEVGILREGAEQDHRQGRIRRILRMAQAPLLTVVLPRIKTRLTEMATYARRAPALTRCGALPGAVGCRDLERADAAVARRA